MKELNKDFKCLNSKLILGKGIGQDCAEFLPDCSVELVKSMEHSASCVKGRENHEIKLKT